MCASDIRHAGMFWKEGSVRFKYIDQGVSIVQMIENSNNQMIWFDTEKKFYTRHEPGEQRKVPARLNVIARPQLDDGAIGELHNMKVETIKPERFAILEDIKRVASLLTGLDPESVVAFGTAEQ